MSELVAFFRSTEIIAPLLLTILVTTFTAMMTAWATRQRAKETAISLEQAKEVADAASAQAQAARARALELLAKKLPTSSDPQELIQAMEKLVLRPVPPISDDERREEENQTWSMVETLINSYHRQALDQARVQFWFSVIAATVGFA